MIDLNYCLNHLCFLYVKIFNTMKPLRMSTCMKIIDSCDKYSRNKRAYCHQGKRICKCFLDRRGKFIRRILHCPIFHT